MIRRHTRRPLDVAAIEHRIGLRAASSSASTPSRPVSKFGARHMSRLEIFD
jgi:hypothetical protein